MGGVVFIVMGFFWFSLGGLCVGAVLGKGTFILLFLVCTWGLLSYFILLYFFLKVDSLAFWLLHDIFQKEYSLFFILLVDGRFDVLISSLSLDLAEG